MKCLLGFSLIEILVITFLLSFLLLTSESVQRIALGNCVNAYYFDIAINQVHSIKEQLEKIDSQSEIKTLTDEWNQENEAVLPFGKGFIEGNFPLLQITLYWGVKTNQYRCDKVSLGSLKCITLPIYLLQEH